jgi:hypothetical protein
MGREKGDGNHSSPKNNLRIQREKRKHIPSSRLQQNKDKLCQGTQRKSEEHPEKRNPANNH